MWIYDRLSPKVQVYAMVSSLMYNILQCSLFYDLSDRLNFISNFKVLPFRKPYAAFRSFSHLIDVFLDVLERYDGTWEDVSILSLMNAETHAD